MTSCVNTKPVKKRRSALFLALGIICFALYALDGFTKFSSSVNLFGPIMIMLVILLCNEFGKRNKPDFTEQMLIKMTEDDGDD